MRLFAFAALSAASLAACNSTDRANVGNAISNTGAAIQNGVETGAEKVGNFAKSAGNAIENGADATVNSFRSSDRGNSAGNASANASGNRTAR